MASFDWSKYQEVTPQANAGSSFDWSKYQEVNAPAATPTLQSITGMKGESMAQKTPHTPFTRFAGDMVTGAEHALGGLIGLINKDNRTGQQLRQANENIALGNPQNWKDKVLSGAVSYAPYFAGGEFLAPETLAGRVAAGTGADALYGAASNPNDKLKGAAEMAGLSLLGQGAGAVIGKGIGKAASMAGNPLLRMMANKAAKTVDGEKLYPELRTPAQAKQALSNIGNMPTTLGQLTGNPMLKKIEGAVSVVPMSGMNEADRTSLALTSKKANDVLGKLLGDSSPESLSGDLVAHVQQAEELARNKMNSLYDPINKYAEQIGATVNSRPNTKEAINKYLNANSLVDNVNSPEFTSQETQFLNRLADDSTPNNSLTFQEGRQVESALKKRARDAGTAGNSIKQTAFNDIAEGMRQDYDHNVVNNLNLPGIKEQLQNANDWAKNNYYSIFDGRNNKDIQDILGGKQENIANVLTKSKNAGLLAQLPQAAKNKIYVAKLGNLVKNNITDGSPEISAKGLMNAYSKAGQNLAPARDKLLDSSTQKEMQELNEMLSLTKDSYDRQLKVNNGKSLEPYAQFALAAGTASHIGFIPSLSSVAGARALKGLLSNPKVLESYANLGENVAAKKIPPKNSMALGRLLMGSMTNHPNN